MLITAAPDWAHSVDHVPGTESPGGGCNRLTGRAASLAGPYLAAFFQNRLTAGPVDRAVYASSTKQSRIGGIHNCVDLLFRHVANFQDKPGFAY